MSFRCPVLVPDAASVNGFCVISVPVPVPVPVPDTANLKKPLSLVHTCGLNTLGTRIRVRTRTRIPNLMATLYYAERVHIAQTQARIPTPFFCIRQESESEYISVSVFKPNNVIKPSTLTPTFASIFNNVCQW